MDLPKFEHPMRRYRRIKGIPLEALAQATNISRGTLSRIETGKQNPSVDLMRRLIAASDGVLSANDFVDGTEAVA
jgi:transcriptional regulator with XRE-family HTH domain